MRDPLRNQLPAPWTPIVIVHGPGAISLATRAMLDKVFGIANQWHQPGLPADPETMRLIRGMLPLPTLLPNLTIYRLALIISHPARYVSDLYQAARAHATHSLHQLASDISVDDFANHDEVRPWTTNPFFTSLTGKTEAANEQQSLESAFTQLHLAEFVTALGTQPDDMLLLAYWLDNVHAWQTQQSQYTEATHWQLSEDTAASVIDRNPLDLAIYKEAQRLTNEQLLATARAVILEASQHKHEMEKLQAQASRLKNELGHQAKANARRAQLIRDFIRKV